MKYRHILLLVTFLTIPFVQGFAQKYLILDVIPKSKRYRYQIGEEFTFRVDEQKDLSKGIITEIGDNYIVLDNLDNILMEQITAVKVHRTGPWSGIRDVTGYVVPVVGVGYFAIETIDNAVNDFDPVVRSSTLTAAVVSIAYGLWMRSLKYKTYKVNENHKLYINDLGSGGTAPFNR